MPSDDPETGKGEVQPLLDKPAEPETKGSYFKIGISFVIAAVWLCTGVWIGCIVEGWQPLTSFYIMVQVLTTIGYGDITVQSQQMKLIMTGHVFVGVLIVAGMLTNFVNAILDKQDEMVRAEIRKVECKVKSIDEKKISESTLALNKLIGALILMLAFMGGGMTFYAFYEPCTCSYGRTKVDGCIEGEMCPKTGGNVKTWIDSFYMSVITLTTVGFGDYSPQSWGGRLFGIFWMVLGVASTANFVGLASAFILTANKESGLDLKPITKEVYDQIDHDKDGCLSHQEFRSYALVTFGLVSSEDLKQIDTIFEAIDTKNTARLTYDELESYLSRQAGK